MEPLVSRDEMRKAETAAVEAGISEVLLMEHAALSLVTALEGRFPALLASTSGLVLAGNGNNGGDVLAAARLLWIRGVRNMRIAILSEPQTEAARLQKGILEKLGIPLLQEWSAIDTADWVLDGIVGTGLARPIEGRAREWIERLTLVKPKPWIVAADIPSGLDAETGVTLGLSIEANQTVTFGYLKRGLVTGQAAKFVGDLRLDPIGLPPTDSFQPSAWLFESGDIAMATRSPIGHKGSFGHAKFWCGEKPGAAIIAAEAAKRTGVGLVTIVGLSDRLASVESKVPPDVLIEPWTSARGATAMGIGPGLGLSEHERLEELMLLSVPLVLDADALTIIGTKMARYLEIIKARKSATVMTPHPREASRLISDLDIERNRYDSVRRLSDTFGIPVLLKGKGTLVAAPGESIVGVWEGNSVLSRGGSGDLLTGIITGLLAQKMNPKEALILGAYLEGITAERVFEERGSEVSVSIAEISQTLGRVIDEYVRS